MSDSFLESFLVATLSITGADRGIAVDEQLQLFAMANLAPEEVGKESFKGCAMRALRQAIDSNEVIVTNNIINDPALAPKTNTKLTGLRFVVAIPIPKVGAIYLDQRVRFGVIPQDTVDDIMRMIQYVQNNNLETNTTEEFCTLYEQLKSMTPGTRSGER